MPGLHASKIDYRARTRALAEQRAEAERKRVAKWEAEKARARAAKGW